MRVFTADMNGNQERMLNVEVGGPLGYYSHFRTSGKQNKSSWIDYVSPLSYVES